MRLALASLQLILRVIIFCALVTACSTAAPQPTSTVTQAPTNTQAPTDTPTPIPTDTPPPADTPTPLPTSTSTSTATPDHTATAMALATQTAEAAFVQIQNDLKPYSITVDKGSLAWIDAKPTDIKLSSYGQNNYVKISDGLVLSDFIMKTEISWESKTGLAGCGVIFRSEPAIESGDSYDFATLRLSGLPAWDIEYYVDGRFDHSVTGKVLFNNLINLKQGATNTYVLVAQGSLFTVYANGGKLGSAESTKRSKGEIAFMGFQESGETTCSFANTWIWSLTD